jgi:dissimilatory sulfite reductase (desulfoviridin) alpha/beta subunit
MDYTGDLMFEQKLDINELKKGGMVPLKEKDMFSIWVKTESCNLNSKQLRKIADITDKYARGFLLFTSRQIPIIPFVNVAHIFDVKRELAEAEMGMDHNGPIVRNLNICYSDKICDDAVVDCIPLGEKLEKFFGSQLAHKIKIVAVGCSKDCVMSRVLNDLSLVGVDDGKGRSYESYVGGRLGINPFVGIKIADHLTENACVNLVQNYFDLLAADGRKGERAADVIKRLSIDEFKAKLTRDLGRNATLPAVHYSTKQEREHTDTMVLKIRAICGEVTSEQVRKIADIAEKYGNSIVHFAVRGAPEIPDASKKSLPAIRKELAAVNLHLLDDNVENMQSCFGDYCSEGLFNPQGLLKRIEKRINELKIEDLKITVSAAGCPSSCGIAHLSDIGFHGVMIPVVDTALCTGCETCVAACKRKTIQVKDKKSVIEMKNCAFCGACRSACTQKAIGEKRRGIAVLLGGRGEPGTRLGTTIAQFVSEDEAFAIADNLLQLLSKTGLDTNQLIDKMGFDAVKRRLNKVSKIKVSCILL